VNFDICIATAAVLWLPGAAILRLTGSVRSTDRATKIATQFAAGLAFWPVIFLWTSLLQLQWTPLVVRCVVGVSAAVAFFPRRRPRFVRLVTFHGSLLLVVLAVTGWTRARTVAGIVLPPWVDSVHHVMLTRLFLLRGGVPATYDPFIPGAKAFYHWGFHSIAAALTWFLGRTDPFSVAANILWLGQFLNVLTPLFVYAATLSLIRSRSAAVIAAALAGLVSYYPAYYVSWGRYTHLAGVLLLLGWMAAAARSRGFHTGDLATLSMLAAGLALVHVRLAFFAVAFTVVLLFRRKTRRAVLAAGAIACVLVLPWLVSIRSVAPGALVPEQGDVRWTSPSDVRANLLWVPHAAELLSVATAGISGIANIGPLSTSTRVLSALWWIAVIVVATIRRRRPRAVLALYGVLAAWCALTMLALNVTHLQFATNTSAAITLFIPVCIGAGALIAWCVAPVSKPATAIIVMACCAIGVATLTHVINPSTVIASQADVEALRWMRASLPATATVLGRVQPWYGGAFIGVDGAYWGGVLADRRSIPPPTLYGWSGSFGEMELFLARWRDEYPAVTHETVAEAQRLGVTHVYFAKGLTPPFGRTVYSRDGVTIVALINDGPIASAAVRRDSPRGVAAAATIGGPTRRTPRSVRRS
jgi:hypothetical protein